MLLYNVLVYFNKQQKDTNYTNPSFHEVSMYSSPGQPLFPLDLQAIDLFV